MVKVTVVGLVCAFFVFYIMTSPDQAAHMVHNIWKVTVDAAHGTGKFFDKVAS